MKKRWLAILAVLFSCLMVWLACGESVAPLLREDGTVYAVSASKKKKKKDKPAATQQPRQTDEATKTPAVTLKPAAIGNPSAQNPDSDGAIITPQAIADYLFAHGELPPNFITKKEARDLGWGSLYRYISDAAPGKSIGGDYFGNYEGLLPTGRGIRYIEADCNYVTGPRKAERIIYSSEGRVWYTGDHYQSFQEMFPSAP